MRSVLTIWSMLTPRQRGASFVLMGMMIVSMLLETLGIGLVVPALAFMSGDAARLQSGAAGRWLDWLGNPTQSQLILLGLVVLLVVYVIKSAFLLGVSYWQSRFIAALQASVSRRLFAIYLAQPWTFHLGRNSSELNRNVSEVQIFASTCTSILNMVAELLVLCGVVGLLLAIEPLGAVVVGGLFGGAAWLFDRLTRSRARRWGKARRRHVRMAGQWLIQGLNGAKDVKIQGCEAEFIRQYKLHNDLVAHAAAHHSFVQQLPRLWFELLAVASLCALTAVLVSQSGASAGFIPTLGLFATAAFRLLPSVNRLSQAVQNLRYSAPIIHGLHDELLLPQEKIPSRRAPPLPFRDAIEVKHVSFRYPAAAVHALRDVSLRIPHGSAVGLIGGSGAGKSTLIDVILGLLAPTSGHVEVDGVDIASNLRGWQRLIGYVPQSIYLCDDSIRNNVAFGVPSDRIDDEAVARALRAAQLDGFVADLPNGAATLVGERGVRLSGGQRQRIGIARALYRDPPILVLDEATSALDNATEAEVMMAVNSLLGAKTLVIVAHRLTTVERCDMIYRFEAGRVVQAGSFAEVVSG